MFSVFTFRDERSLSTKVYPRQTSQYSNIWYRIPSYCKTGVFVWTIIHVVKIFAILDIFVLQLLSDTIIPRINAFDWLIHWLATDSLITKFLNLQKILLSDIIIIIIPFMLMDIIGVSISKQLINNDGRQLLSSFNEEQQDMSHCRAKINPHML